MQIIFKSYGDLGRDINKNFEKFSGDWDLVVGIPRSGMVPAYMIALALNVNCTDISSWVNNYPLKKGMTRGLKNELTLPWEAKKVLIVDDSIMSGNSLKSEIEALPAWLSSRASTLAVYSSKPFRKDVDIVLEFVPHPRAFEWNIFHHKVISRSCISLEGMIKKSEEENNKNEINFRYIPSGLIDTIVSCQSKSKRQEVESLLAERGVSYRELVMSDSEDNVMTLENLINFKVGKFTDSSSDLFIEYDSYQARIICQEAKKPVFCIKDNCMYNPGDELGSRFFKNKVKSLMWKVVNVKVRKQGLFM
ncbi:phosphoribosyltransferase [Halomonas sp. 7T]|uniref:phosphoribosyltransferase n=1 Tax=Halomonas sp. 7T TaxID=2893469 RepID=UPI0021DB1958|nr:phosphoribosyltransferase [Halomonas sp. 7T]UXZ55431.1 phosphoribosyltransferase [Halomonas sp. 7T]